MRKKAQDSLRKELAKNTNDKYSVKVFAKQIAQNERQKNRVLGQKAKIQNMEYGLDTYFCKELSLWSQSEDDGCDEGVGWDHDADERHDEY